MLQVVSCLAGGLFSMEMSSSSLRERERGKASDRIWLSGSADIMTTERVARGHPTYTPSGRERRDA